MYQAIDKEKFELSPPKSDSALFSQLLEHSNEIIFLHPTLSLFFDNLTINRFIHKEIIVTFDFPFELPSAITINKLPPLKMESFTEKLAIPQTSGLEIPRIGLGNCRHFRKDKLLWGTR